MSEWREWAQIHENQTQILIALALNGGEIDDEDAELYVDRHDKGNYRIVPLDEVSDRRRRANVRRRQERIAAAREKGTHTKAEWTALVDVFGQCVRCGIPYELLNGGVPTKDHIIPISLGGCDCIANIQPMCRNCNSARTFEMIDHRPSCRVDWARRFTARLENGWE